MWLRLFVGLLVSVAALVFRVLILYTGFYVAVRLRTVWWRLVFHAKTRGMPGELAKQLRQEYSRALSALALPSPFTVAGAIVGRVVWEGG